MNKLYLLIIFFGLFLYSCKPTEKGYKSAYDAALNKRQSMIADLGDNISETEFMEVDGPQLKTIEGHQVYILNNRLSPYNSDLKQLPGSYNVAVSIFKMPTNCLSSVNNLKGKGYDALSVKDSDGKYYVVAGSVATMEEAIAIYEKIKNENDLAFVGLPDSPIIIYSGR